MRRAILGAVLLAFFLSGFSLAFDEGSVYDRVMEYTKELLLNLSTLSQGAKKSFFDGVNRGVKEALKLTEGMKLSPQKLEESLKSVIKASLLWRLSGREVKLLLEGFGRFLWLGFTVEGAGEIVKRFIIRDLGAPAFKRVSWLVNVAVKKYGVPVSSIESLLKEKLSMLELSSRRELIRGIIVSLKEKIREARKR